MVQPLPKTGPVQEKCPIEAIDKSSKHVERDEFSFELPDRFGLNFPQGSHTIEELHPHELNDAKALWLRSDAQLVPNKDETRVPFIDGCSQARP
jgi:hypothetical protein